MSHEPTRLAADDRVGTRIGEYQIDALIGVGGMGKVYQATAGDGTLVALKLVKEDLARDETFRRRFRREARIAQTVRNPHVVVGARHGRARRPSLPGGAVHRRRRARSEARAGRSTRPGHDREDLRAGRRRPPGAVGGGDGAPRRQARQHPARPERRTRTSRTSGSPRTAQGTVLTRPGQPLGSMDYMPPGADPRRAGDRCRRHLLARVRDVRMRGRTAAVRRSPGDAVLWAHLQDEPPDPSAERTDISPEFAQALKAALRKDPARATSHQHRVRALALTGCRHPDRRRSRLTRRPLRTLAVSPRRDLHALRLRPSSSSRSRRGVRHRLRSGVRATDAAGGSAPAAPCAS